MNQHAQQLVTSIEGHLNTLREALPTLSVDVQALRSACESGRLDGAEARIEEAEKATRLLHAVRLCACSLEARAAELNLVLREDVVKCCRQRVALLEAENGEDAEANGSA